MHRSIVGLAIRQCDSIISYVYLADGTKLREIRSRKSFSLSSGSNGYITNITDYIGSYELEDNRPTRLLLPGGFMTLADTVYHHYIPDYQGNIAVVINTKTRSVEQKTSYYPYGMPHDNSYGAGAQRRKYGAKELTTFAGYGSLGLSTSA